MRSIGDHYDVAVVGAGPAGMAAAAFCARAGFSTLVLDANPEPGGHAYRGIVTTPLADRAILGEDFWRGESLARELTASGAKFAGSSPVTHLGAEGDIHASVEGVPTKLHATYVVLAPGALERKVVIPGRELAGVSGVRRAMRDYVASGSSPQGRVVLAGTGLLLWQAAARLARGGAHVVALLDTTPREHVRAAWRHFPAFMFSPQAGHFLGMRARVWRATAIARGVHGLEALGDSRLGEVRYRDGGGNVAALAADVLLLHEGVIPNLELPRSGGIAVRWDERQQCEVPEVGPFGISPIPGVYVVGEVAGGVGPQAAAWQGVLAAADIVHTRKPEVARKGAQLATTALRGFARGQRFLDRFHRPVVVKRS